MPGATGKKKKGVLLRSWNSSSLSCLRKLGAMLGGKSGVQTLKICGVCSLNGTGGERGGKISIIVSNGGKGDWSERFDLLVEKGREGEGRRRIIPITQIRALQGAVGGPSEKKEEEGNSERSCAIREGGRKPASSKDRLLYRDADPPDVEHVFKLAKNFSLTSSKKHRGEENLSTEREGANGLNEYLI